MIDDDFSPVPVREEDDCGVPAPLPLGTKIILGSQTWVFCERWPRTYSVQDGYELLFRNVAAPNIARWMHDDELQALQALGVVHLP